MMDFENLTPEAMQRYVRQHREDDYMVIDVRQPAEYADGHIPGAQLIPLDQLESNPAAVPGDRDVFFYCRSGARSQAAAVIYLDSGRRSDQKVYSLKGGMLGWDGHSLADFPRLAAFDPDAPLSELMLTSMQMEKAALRFYRHLAQRHAAAPWAGVLEKLQRAEKAHAGMVYEFWRPLAEAPPPFAALFDSLRGDILEGGQHLDDALADMDALKAGDGVQVLEFALNIEVEAYDLYRTMADRSENAEIRNAFMAIAQMEKKHMQLLADVFRPFQD